jgi:hypothetical protein
MGRDHGPGRDFRDAHGGLRLRFRGGKPGWSRGSRGWRGQRAAAGQPELAARRKLGGHRLVAPPHPRDDHDLVFLRERSQPAPGSRLAEIAQLGNDELGQSLALQHRPGGQPRQHPGGQYVKPERRVAKREPENRENNHIGDGDGSEYSDLA